MEKEPDTVLIKEDTGIGDLNRDESVRLTASSSSGPFKNIKDTEDESPWLSKVKDPFQDSETPWLSKIKDPFKETPISTKVVDSYDHTPNTTRKMFENSENTPSAAHKVFQKLREKQNQEELDFDSQTVPTLFKDTQPVSPLKSSDEANDTNVPNSNEELDFTRIDRTSQPAVTQTIDHGFEAERVHHSSQSHYPHSENTQPDIQVLGTAPEADTQAKEHFSSQNEQVELQDTKRISSPINSDDENDFSLDLEKKLKTNSTVHQFDIIPDDSLQKHHRVLSKKANISHIETLPHSRSFSGETQRTSHGKRLNSLPIKIDNRILDTNEVYLPNNTQQKEPILNTLNITVKPHEKSHLTSSPNVEESSLAIRAAVDNYQVTKQTKEDQADQVDFNALAENITQEISDVDDDSKGDVTIDNTIEEEATDTNDKGNSLQALANSSYPIRKFRRNRRNPHRERNIELESSPDKTNGQSDASAILDANTSQINDDQDITMSSAGNGVLGGILRNETHKLTENDNIFKSCVWCLHNTRYYPGLIVGRENEVFEIKFYESTNKVTTGIYPLDIQIGDIVKIERLSYIITGLERVIRDINEDVIRCMRGYDTVLVKRIKGKGKNRHTVELEEKFALGEIRIENEEWHKRPRLHNDDYDAKPKRFPISQLSKQKRSMPKSYEEELILSTPKKLKLDSSNIFSECVFVISGDVDKDELSRSIISNGGTVLREGFASKIKFADGSASSEMLQKFKFSALIAEKYLRSEKYLETVALAWPVLSQEFIYDCLSENELIGKLSPYLLPAGESSKLKGVAKSIDISAFVEHWKLGYNLSHQLNNNKILEDRNVFICSEKNSEITSFLFNILGSNKVTHLTLTNFTNLINSISETIDDGTRNLVYHNNIDSIKSILDNKQTLKSKGRRSRKGLILSEVSQSNRNLKLELVDWEWLVQCVISSRPWDSSHIWSNKSTKN